MADIKYYQKPERIDATIMERVKKLSPAQLCDGMKTLEIVGDGCMDVGILPVDDQKVMVGTVCTISTDEGDNFPIHVAVYEPSEGYVMVIDGKGYQGRAYLGDLIGAAANAVGYDGIVVDGCVRDKEGLKNLDIPIFARGFMQRGPSKKGPGEINSTIFCGGIRVEPGDLIMGDCDGVAVVPRDRILDVLEKAEAKKDYEVDRRKKIAEYEKRRNAGETLPEIAPQWVIDMKKDMGL
ncbi:MAG: S-adenosylmethionine--2-demethylmenaquinone methyltransferase [delta proteobacterium ML8_F1]|nr:MAG: S-adenosylmethionine--2-demethylmenaquinone methyltransferase [delta proteobacterium ML8_F1]